MEMGVEGAVDEGLANRRVISAAHWESNRTHQTHGLNFDNASGLNDLFNLYRMEWTPAGITTYINDIQIWTLDIAEIPAFHQPRFLLLNMAVGGVHTGICDTERITAPFPAEYRVDYIRVYDNGHTVLEDSTRENAPERA